MRQTIAIAVALTALAAPASAAPWVGTFQLAVSGGSVDDQWTVHHADAGPCDVAQSGSGTETGTLAPGAPVVLTLAGVGTTAFLAPAAGLKTVAQLDRQGTITNGPDDGDDTAGCPSGGGESPPPAPDCGPSTLPLSVVFAPAEKPALTVTPPPETTTYLNCPVAGTVLPATPNGLVSAPLVSGIGPAPGPGTVAISLRGTDVISDADSDATSTLAVDLRLDRIAVVEALDLADTFHDAHVDDKGITRLPVRCPAGSTCSGRIGIAAGSDGASASRAAKQPRWPRPLLTPEPLVGSARFSIKGGRSARIPVRIAHGSAVALQGLAFETLDVIVRQRAGNASKPVAFVAGQVRIRVG